LSRQFPLVERLAYAVLRLEIRLGSPFCSLFLYFLPMVRRVPGYRQNVLGSEICLPDGALTLYRNNNGL
jgi:hypothetical protein